MLYPNTVILPILGGVAEAIVTLPGTAVRAILKVRSSLLSVFFNHTLNGPLPEKSLRIT